MKIEKNFFHSPAGASQRRYEALRAFHYDNQSARNVAKRFGYTLSTFYSMARDFKKALLEGKALDDLFVSPQYGRKPMKNKNEVVDAIIGLRKKYLPVTEIKEVLDAKGTSVSETFIYSVVKDAGFEKLPRRNKKTQVETRNSIKIPAPKAELLKIKQEAFNTSSAGVLCFIPYIVEYGLDKLIGESRYPETKTLPRLNSILCFLSLKLSDFSRYTEDDLWCMDRGSGMFAGLNVLPKAAWFTSYSHKVSREMNMEFLSKMNKLWHEKNIVSDTANLDFTAIPYWGDNSHLENNWSGKRNQALSSILAALSHDPESGIITYGDAGVRHENESNVILEFLDFHKSGGGSALKYLVFDSKFTTYENLSRLDDDGIKFVTIRRRGKKIVEELNVLPKSAWKNIRVDCADGRKRLLKVVDQEIFLKGYGKKLRQIAVAGNGKIKPALIITNDFNLGRERLVRKYARRWLVEKTISEQIYFFHLNKVSSSMVIKVDFDLTMTILAYNLYRLLAMDLDGYGHNSAKTLHDKFIRNSGNVEMDIDGIMVKLKKKRNLPAILEAMNNREDIQVPWLQGRKVIYEGANHT